MKILAVETSCDETAISILEVKKIDSKTQFKILGNEISSQIELHTQYGGVFPMMAKREHGKNILYILEKVLKEAKLYKKNTEKIDLKKERKIEKILERENELKNLWKEVMPNIKNPKIDAVCVTVGPGLEPALWVGISFAKAIATYWDIPLVPVNHMEGHIFSIFPKKGKTFSVDSKDKIFPILSLLVSGGHTELIVINDWMKYKKIGQTRDDAAGEAFDKVARMLGLSYPGGPEISKYASANRINEDREITHILPVINLPRPMIYSKDYDFSFSGLKTAVLYLIRDLKEKDKKILENEIIKQKIAREFEDSVVETLSYKTIKAIKEYKIKTLIVGGGVSANKYLQDVINSLIKNNKLKTKVNFPNKNLTGDNALMIAIAGYFQYKNKKFAKNLNKVVAKGHLSL